MTESDKAKEAKARLEQARKDAQDAQSADIPPAKQGSSASKSESRTADTLKKNTGSDSSPASSKPTETKPSDPSSPGKGSDVKAETPPSSPKSTAPSGAASAVAASAAATATNAAHKDTVHKDTPHKDAAHTPDEEDDDEDETHGRSVASHALQWIAILVVGGAVALWAGPKIAPHLPGWASPVAKFLTPGSNQSDQAIAQLSASTDAQITALEAKIADLEAAINGGIKSIAQATDLDIADTRAQLEQQIADIGASVIVDEVALRTEIDAIAGRTSSAEAMLEGLRAEIDSLTGVSPSGNAPSAETLERVAAFGAAVEGLRGEIAALSVKTAKIDMLATNQALGALNDRVKALEGGEAATDRAAREAKAIRTAARLDAALAHIDQALQAGMPFSAALEDATRLTGADAPPALAALADTGSPTTNALLRQFGEAAKLGYAAAQSADAGDGFGARLLAGIEGRLGGRPSVETQGDDAGAVLSRIEARLNEGRLAAAHAETENLPPATKTAMQGWLDDLSAAHSAAAALADWHTALRAN